MAITKATYQKRVKKLVEALRSGEYKQCKAFLHRKDRFCCLGVACDLAKAKLGVDWESIGTSSDGTIGRFFGLSDVMSEDVMEYYGFTDPEGAFTVPIETRSNAVLTSLTELNDGGYNFRRIADIIESHREGLFTW